MQGSFFQNDLEFALSVLYYRILAFMKTALVFEQPAELSVPERSARTGSTLAQCQGQAVKAGLP
jgi:hypothetical protein